ncbi:hypothetical protein FLA_2514 [Filimonas lacunae]|nr:hypothetical protein FLA_2514 [Filimonas lacunae]
MGRMYFFSLQFVPTEEVSEEIAVSSMEAFWKNGHKNYTSLCEVRESLFDNLTTRCTNAVKQEEGVFLIADKQLNTQQLEKHIKISNLKAEVAFIYHLQKEKKNGKDDGEENKPEEPKKENPEENNENKNDPES